MNWELETLNEKDLGNLQNALEDMWMNGQTSFPSWVVPLHDAILAEWDKREVPLSANAADYVVNGVSS